MANTTTTDVPFQVPDLSKTYGAALIGLLVTCFLSGIMTLQVHIFFQRSQKDRIYLKLLVLVVWTIDMIHLGGISGFVYHFVISNWGNKAIIGQSIWELGLEEMLNTWITFLVQMFLIYRISVLSKYSRWALTPLLLLAFIQLGFGTGGGIKSMLPQPVSNLASTRWRAAIWLISGAVNDILIASILSYYLWSQRTVMSSRIVDKLIAYAISEPFPFPYSPENGTHRYAYEASFPILKWIVVLMVLDDSILAFIDIGLFISMPGNYIHLAFNFVLGRIYTNSLLASLNMRHTLRQGSTYRPSTSGVTGQYATPVDVSEIRVQMSHQEESRSYSDGKVETLILRETQRSGSQTTMEFAKSEAEAV